MRNVTVGSDIPARLGTTSNADEHLDYNEMPLFDVPPPLATCLAPLAISDAVVDTTSEAAKECSVSSMECNISETVSV